MRKKYVIKFKNVWIKEFNTLVGADLRNANLMSAGLESANLSNADLSNADLSNADLRHADLRGADLSNADLRHALLKDSNFARANNIHRSFHEHTGVVSGSFGVHRYVFHDDILRIGCEIMTLDDWRKYYKEIGKENGYTEENIEKYGKLIKFLKTI